MGVGFKSFLENGSINLKVGLSHNVAIPVPVGVKCQIPTPTKIILMGCDLREITALAAVIRRVRPPEPYSGKGIYVGDETIERKAGKKNK